MSLSLESILKLRQLPAFREYATRKFGDDPEFWHHEARFGGGIMGAVARAVVEIGGDRT